MAEKQKSTIQSLFSEIGIPVAGDPGYEDVKPNTTIHPWPGPFESIHEAFDPAYAKAKELSTIQRSALDKMLAGYRVLDAVEQHERVTVGQALALDPGFPIPPGALKPGPQVNTEQSLVPETFDIGRLQHGATSAASPGIAPLREFTGDVGRPYRMAPGQPTRPTFYTDPGMATRQLDTHVPDLDALLPPIFQQRLEAQQHREGLQRPAPHYASAEEQKLKLGIDLGINAFKFKHGREPNPEELNNIYTEVTGGFDKAPKPGSLGEKKLEGEARASQAKGDFAQVREEAEVFATGQKGKRDQADAAETWDLMGARLEEITQKSLLEKAQASSAYQKAEAGQFNEALAAAKLYGAINKSTKLSTEDKVNLMNSVLGQQKDGSTFDVIPKQTPSEAFFGLAPSKTEVKPKELGKVPEQPTSEQSDIERAEQAYFLSIYKSMRIGEEKVIKGKRYRKTVKGLEELN